MFRFLPIRKMNSIAHRESSRQLNEHVSYETLRLLTILARDQAVVRKELSFTFPGWSMVKRGRTQYYESCLVLSGRATLPDLQAVNVS